MDLKKMSSKELNKERYIRQQMIDLNRKTGIQSDYDRKIIEKETDTLQKELDKINQILKNKQNE